jgi:preprotein translocase subunit SecB
MKKMKEKNILLQLETHFYTKVIVEANPRYNPEKNGDQFTLITNVDVGQHKEDPRRWQIILELKTQPKAKMPYKIDLECVGLFEVSPDVKVDMMGPLVRANGTAILYSSAREFLLLITGRGPWDSFYLPTTNFLEPLKPKKEEKGSALRSQVKGPKRKKLDEPTDTQKTK